MPKPYIIAWLIKLKGKIHRMAAKMLTCNWCSWLPNNDYIQFLRNWTTSCYTIASACASYKKGGSSVSTTSTTVDIPHTREASSTLPKEHRLRCHRASGITGGGCNRDNSLRHLWQPALKRIRWFGWPCSDALRKFHLQPRIKNFLKFQVPFLLLGP